jgi:formamidopyrimidine-DNA glycosylase
VEASFSDPRKFGSVILSTTTAQSDFFDNLAPDALTSFHVVDGLVGQAVGIKALLLDQKRVVSGVGNWVADEVLYQSELHPEQTFLSRDQAVTLQTRLHCILNTAIACLDDRREFPESWLFHCRWEKRASNSGTKIKDPMGRTVVFLKAAGRTCAIVPSIQIKRSQNQKVKSNLKKRESDALNADDGITKQDADTVSDKRKAKRQRKTGNAKDAAVEGTPAKSKRRSPRFMNLR